MESGPLTSEELLVDLYNYLLSNYDLNFFDGSTRDLLDTICEHIKDEPIEWPEEEEE